MVASLSAVVSMLLSVQGSTASTMETSSTPRWVHAEGEYVASVLY
jgi:hypothetical protein